jgi:hypothetical protein
MPKINSMYLESKFYASIYKKHTTKRLQLNFTEYLDMTIDERKFNLSYSEILKQIEGGKIDPNQLGLKM